MKINISFHSVMFPIATELFQLVTVLSDAAGTVQHLAITQLQR